MSDEPENFFKTADYRNLAAEVNKFLRKAETYITSNYKVELFRKVEMSMDLKDFKREYTITYKVQESSIFFPATFLTLEIRAQPLTSKFLRSSRSGYALLPSWELAACNITLHKQLLEDDDNLKQMIKDWKRECGIKEMQVSPIGGRRLQKAA
jgi:hypothetical protein